MVLIVLLVFMPRYAIFISLFPYSLIAAASDAQIINHWPSPVEGPASGNLQLLMREGNQSSLVHHRCDRDTLLYVRGSAYLTRDSFATALDPLFIPSHLLQEGTDSSVLQSATFTGDNLVMAVGNIILAYNLKTEQLSRATGIPDDVAITHVASFQCCYNDTEWCQKQDRSVVAYSSHSTGTDWLEYYLSLDAGWTFAVRRLQLDFDVKGEIFGATILGSLSAVAFLVVKDSSDSAQFIYDYVSPSAVNMTKPVSLPFSVSGNQTSFVQFESGVGSLVIWDRKNIYYSAVSGKAVVKAVIHPQAQSSALSDGEVVRQVITNNGDFAVLTSGGNLYFGREGLPPRIVQLPLKSPLPCPGHSCVIRFTESNNIRVLYSADRGGVDIPPTAKLQLLSELVHIQQRLAKVTPALKNCQHQGFVTNFHDQLYYLDLGQRLELSAKVIPSAWKHNSYMVTVSNPGILCVKTGREVSGPQARGVVFTNLFAHITLVADTLPDGRKDEARGMSTLTMSMHDSSLMCHHKQQAVAHVLAGCPPNRNIRVRKNEEECPNMRDYIYTIDKDVYDPTFLMGSTGITEEDKEVSYDYNKLGCPIVVYYQDMLKPVIDLYDGDVFVEEVNEDFVVNEINGMFTYSYVQTAQQAGCKSQPQSWLSLLTAQGLPNPATAWTRQNYWSCMQEDSTGLTNPDQPYEILSSRNSNQLKWSRHNSILVLNVSVLNSDYSLCQLRGQFAVRVYGVLPQSTLAPLRIMLGTCGLGLTALVAFYIALRLWPKDGEEGGKEGGKDT